MILEILTALWKMAMSFVILCIVAGAAAFAGGIVALGVALLHRLADEIKAKSRKKKEKSK